MTRELRRYLRLFRDGRKLLATSLLISLAEAAVLTPIPLVIKHVFDADLRRWKGERGGRRRRHRARALPRGFGLRLAQPLYGAEGDQAGDCQLRSELVAKIFSLPSRSTTTPISVSSMRRSCRTPSGSTWSPTRRPVRCFRRWSSRVAWRWSHLCSTRCCSLCWPVPVRRWCSSSAVSGAACATAPESGSGRLTGSALTQARAASSHVDRGAGADQLERDRLSREAAELSDAGLEMSWRQGALTITQGAVAAVAAVLVLVIGGREVANGQLTTGDLLAFYAIVALLQAQVSTIVTVVPLAISGRESLDRLSEFLDLDQPAPYHGRHRISLHRWHRAS